MADLNQDFILDSLDALLEHYDKQPDPNSIHKVSDHLTPEYRQWLRPVKFAILATAGANGLDCSPRGDAEPLFLIEDDRTILMPDWRGNNRLDTLRNLVSITAIGLICLIPGVGETLRIGGSAQISIDPSLLSRFEKNGKLPRSIVVISINRVYFQCARAVYRSELWNAEDLPKNIPSAGQMTQGARPDFDADAYDSALFNRQMNTLWSDD